jgi:hypothetical protein
VEQLRELVELLGPGGLQDVLAVLVHEVGAKRAAAEQPYRPCREFLAVPPGERHGRLEPVEHVCRAAEDDSIVGLDVLDILDGPGLG